MKYEIKCNVCGNSYTVDCTESNYKNNRYRKTCSVYCAHKRAPTKETCNKISESLKSRKRSLRITYCKICGREMINVRLNKVCCSDKCKKISGIIKTLEKYFNFNINTIGSFKVFDEIDRIRTILFNDYWNNSLTGIELGKKYNYPSPCNITGKIFKYLNIPTRNCKDTNKLNMLNGKISPSTLHCNYINGWHTTWNNKEVYLRSSYEFDYAEDLDEQKIDYDVECLRIKYWDNQKQEFRCAIPDFYLPETNTIVEIKSNYTFNKDEMIDKFNEYKKLGYNVKLILEHKEVKI